MCSDENTSFTPFCDEYDIIFILESNLTASVLPNFAEYTAIANPSLKYCNHGGIAVYVKNYLIKSVMDISFNECYVTFRLDTAPNYLFGGVYIQPENSKYFSPNMFADLDTLLLRCTEHNFIPFIGGDFNARMGDFNELSTLLHYQKNVDMKTNKHGRLYMTDICKRNNVYPVNHMKYGGVMYKGDFTYYKKEKKSQIDIVLTNKEGRKDITSFDIVDTNWHVSDHRPTSLQLRLSCTTPSYAILARAEDMNYEYSSTQVKIQKHNKSYNSETINEYINNNKDLRHD